MRKTRTHAHTTVTIKCKSLWTKKKKKLEWFANRNKNYDLQNVKSRKIDKYHCAAANVFIDWYLLPMLPGQQEKILESGFHWICQLKTGLDKSILNLYIIIKKNKKKKKEKKTSSLLL